MTALATELSSANMRALLKNALASALAASALLMAGVQAQGITLYRCTDANGTVSVQNTPCPAGSTQSERNVGAVPSQVAPPTAMPTAAAASGGPLGIAAAPTQPAETSARILDSATLQPTPAEAAQPHRPAPPTLYQCRSAEGHDYLGEDPEPAPRCKPLQTVGLDGNPALGAGQACEVLRDTCSAVEPAQACDAWHRYARNAQTRWRLAHPDNLTRREQDYRRLAAIVSASCGD